MHADEVAGEELVAIPIEETIPEDEMVEDAAQLSPENNDVASVVDTAPEAMNTESSDPESSPASEDSLPSQEVLGDEPVGAPSTDDTDTTTLPADSDDSTAGETDAGEEATKEESPVSEQPDLNAGAEEDLPETDTSSSVEDTEESASDGALASSTPTDVVSTSSAPFGPALDVPVSVNFSDSGFTFSKDECTELASGSFYCLEPRENVLEDALFAAPDMDGDLEIFLVRNGAQTQVTDNFVDDAAPFFDQNSETIVWHRLIDDRYQIISYDLASGEEVQLTKSGGNNMEPIRQGRYTVWQRWVNNNWEIILHDGTKEVQVSHASAHDIAPYIHGSLIVWNRYGATGEKTIEMYDIASETYVTVDDPEGMSVTNPRMVLVYDQMHPNGDIVTKGYDMIARRFIQLDTLPRELPDEIPASEPTSETRALIQSKPTVKSDEVVQGEPTTGGEPPLPDLPATSTDPLTLDMSQATATPLIDTPSPELSSFDLVILPLDIDDTGATTSVQE